jgi:TRAP-type C4-dicarboxylate transport system permease small subunit
VLWALAVLSCFVCCCLFVCLFWHYWSSNSGLHTASDLPLDPYPQSFLLQFFSDRVLNFLPRLASVHKLTYASHVAGITDTHTFMLS